VRLRNAENPDSLTEADTCRIFAHVDEHEKHHRHGHTGRRLVLRRSHPELREIRRTVWVERPAVYQPEPSEEVVIRRHWEEDDTETVIVETEPVERYPCLYCKYSPAA
jgi:hypothetical protein